MARSGSVLCYHSITGPGLPSSGLINLSPDLFRTCIEVARSLGEIVPLRELAERHHAGKSTAGLTAITFDDAYASIPELLGSYLTREQIPVTLFVVVEAAATGTPFWWDRLDDLLERLAPAEWRELEDACGMSARFRDRWPEYGRHWPLREWIVWGHRGRWPAELTDTLLAFEARAGHTTPHRPMVWEELERFAALPNIDVGVHTVSHPVLPLLDDAAVRHEVGAGYRRLRERIPKAVPILAMPFGLFDRRTVSLARQAGMETSLSLANTTLRAYSAGDEIPRFCITRKETALKLAVRLTGLPERVRALQGISTRYPPLSPADLAPSEVAHGAIERVGQRSIQLSPAE